MTSASFSGLRVLSLESRHAKEINRLIESYGGRPVVVPALREVRLEPNSHATEFAAGLLDERFDMVIFLTGAGIRGLFRAMEGEYPREQIVEALKSNKLVARGPKPASALMEFGLTPDLTAPEPNTWREILRVLDENPGPTGIEGTRIAVQEYGVPCTGLLTGLRERGAYVTRVPVYHWSLPDDREPLREAATRLAAGEIDVILLTAAVQVEHLLQIASELGLEESLRRHLNRMVVASVGPTTSEHLGAIGLRADIEASHPRMGFLVEEAARKSAAILQEKHAEPGLDFLHEMGSWMAESSPLDDALTRTVEFAASVVKCDSCFVYIL